MKTNNILAIMFALVIVPTSAFAIEQDLSVFSRNRSFNDYQRENETHNMQMQQMMMQQQAEEMRQQNQATPEAPTPAFGQGFQHIVGECAQKLAKGTYKTRESMVKKCTSPQAIKLVQQLNTPPH